MRLVLVAAALLGLALVAALPVRADDDAGWKALHARYTGFTFGDGKLRTLTAGLTVTIKGKPKTEARWHRIGILSRTDASDLTAHTVSSNGYTGNLFWYADENGFTVPVAGIGAMSQLADNMIFSDAIATLPWKMVRNETVDNVAYVVLRAEHGDGFPFEIYLNPQTGAYGRIIVDPKGDHEARMRVLDYAEAAPGLKVISHWRYEDTGEDNSSTLHDIVGNAPVSTDDLHPPAPTAHWTFGSGIVPLRFTHKRIVVRATVNGVPGTFMIDTGAAGIFLSGAFARRAGIKPLGHTDIYSLYGTEQNDTGRVDTFAFGDSVLHDVEVLFGSPDVDETAPDGLIGFPFFAGTVTTIDFENANMHIEDAAAPSVPGAGVAVQTDFSSGQPVVPMLLNKSLAMSVTLDTGSPEWLLIPASMPSRYGLRMRGGGTCGTLDDLTLGPIAYKEPYACAVLGQDGRDALAGLDFLQQFSKIRFDYSRAIVEFVGRTKK